MRVLLLGGTGSIGAPLLDALRQRGHRVLAVVRSSEAEARLQKQGVETLRGDIRNPQDWAASAVGSVEVIIHVAATFSDDMGDVDRQLVDTLVSAIAETGRRFRFIYTGGCWLFGETGNAVADETSPFDPIPSFAWMIKNWQRLEKAAHLDAILVHPAMVYDRDGGVLTRFMECARDKGRIEIWGSAETRWPVVHRQDLATAYCLALEAGQPGESYCAAAETGVRVGSIVQVLGQRFGLSESPVMVDREVVLSSQGDWAAGPMLDQQMSGRKLTTELGWSPQVRDILSEIG